MRWKRGSLRGFEWLQSSPERKNAQRDFIRFNPCIYGINIHYNISWCNCCDSGSYESKTFGRFSSVKTEEEPSRKPGVTDTVWALDTTMVQSERINNSSFYSSIWHHERELWLAILGERVGWVTLPDEHAPMERWLIVTPTGFGLELLVQCAAEIAAVDAQQRGVGCAGLAIAQITIVAPVSQALGFVEHDQVPVLLGVLRKNLGDAVKEQALHVLNNLLKGWDVSGSRQLLLGLARAICATAHNKSFAEALYSASTFPAHLRVLSAASRGSSSKLENGSEETILRCAVRGWALRAEACECCEDPGNAALLPVRIGLSESQDETVLEGKDMVRVATQMTPNSHGAELWGLAQNMPAAVLCQIIPNNEPANIPAIGIRTIEDILECSQAYQTLALAADCVTCLAHTPVQMQEGASSC
ncbi:Sodium channel protein type 2 subunit alpha [Platysternon megacephalum]|uniref:Sodium channel protein type 2 subunit alpha n=1 Tax=Platysternon megacephalum TaxID=55544 RepID=A0A4D9F5K8_9SAUR|nr:Sodium channel protein type 2 subunit alpha [Platysternon megacephalum]